MGTTGDDWYHGYDRHQRDNRHNRDARRDTLLELLRERLEPRGRPGPVSADDRDYEHDRRRLRHILRWSPAAPV